MTFSNPMTRHLSRCGAAFALAATLFSAGSSRVLAQNAAQPAGAALPRISLTAGRSTVLPVDFDVTRIAVTNPAVADAVATGKPLIPAIRKAGYGDGYAGAVIAAGALLGPAFDAVISA